MVIHCFCSERIFYSLVVETKSLLLWIAWVNFLCEWRRKSACSDSWWSSAPTNGGCLRICGLFNWKINFRLYDNRILWENVFLIISWLTELWVYKRPHCDCQDSWRELDLIVSYFEYLYQQPQCHRIKVLRFSHKWTRLHKTRLWTPTWNGEMNQK